MSGTSKYKSRLRDDTQSSGALLETSFWKESPSDSNAFQVADAWCHGYNLFELASKRGFVDVFYLLFKGELPSSEQARFLNQLMILLINPGPRHPATRAGITASASMTYEEHLVPIVTSAFGGKRQGAGNMRRCARFLDEVQGRDVAEVAGMLLSEDVGDGHAQCLVASEFGESSVWVDRVLTHLRREFPDNHAVLWLLDLNRKVVERSSNSKSITLEALVTYLLGYLGFNTDQLVGVYQMFVLPGLFAHASEYVSKPANSLPFVQDENYVIED